MGVGIAKKLHWLKKPLSEEKLSQTTGGASLCLSYTKAQWRTNVLIRQNGLRRRVAG